MSQILRCALGDLPLLPGSALELPLRGNWSALAVCHLPDGASALPELSPVSLVLTREDGAEDVFVGAVRRSGVEEGRALLVTAIAGGAGKLLANVRGRDHAPGVSALPAGLVARGICDDAGEQLVDGVEAALDLKTVRRWTRIEAPGRDALDLLADVLGLGWRVLPSGRVWVGAETWPEIEAEKRLLPDPDDGAESWATDGAPILPGVTLGGRRIVEVRYQLGGQARATVRAAVSGDPPRWPRLDAYRVVYGARVVRQDDDGTLDVVADDPRLGGVEGVRSVPFRVGVPGARAVGIPAGARVRLAFEGADPRGVYAMAPDEDPAAEAAFALVGDAVNCGTISGVANLTTGVVTFTVTAPGGSPGVGVSPPLIGRVTGPGHKYVKGVSA